MADETTAIPAGEVPTTELSVNGLYKLSPPLKLANGKIIEQLDLDLDKLKGKGIKAVAAQFRQVVKEFTAVPWADERYQLIAVARLNGIIYEDLDELGGKDTVFVMRNALDFFGERV